ncbi:MULTISPECIES: transketolase family protein [unclassified Streptococcus]|uniref:transketolase family protein n=1 Tax=unclassified Streptococcus TaxID=2608887 RepID=UPI0015657A85|nr:MULTISPECIES: transketolase family protein [unclassified Streptococcus]
MMRSTKELRHVYRDFLLEANQSYSDIVVLEADLSSSMATNNLEKDFGDRYVNVGIMEAEMVGLAAGLSIQGFRPYLHTFGPFASRRVFDQLFISLGYAQLDATVIGSDAGVTAEMNGGTHMPFEEIGLLRLIPKSIIFEATDDIQFREILNQTLDLKGLKYIRTIRKAPEAVYQGGEDFSKGYVELRHGEDVVIVASGIMVAPSIRVADELSKLGYSVGVIDLFRIKPIPEQIKTMLSGKTIFTVENHNQIGGIGSALCELFSDDGITKIHRMGVQERFGQVGKMDYLLNEYGLSESNIKEKVLEFYNAR